MEPLSSLKGLNLAIVCFAHNYFLLKSNSKVVFSKLGTPAPNILMALSNEYVLGMLSTKSFFSPIFHEIWPNNEEDINQTNQTRIETTKT